MAGLTASPPITRTGGDTLFMLLTFSVTALFFFIEFIRFLMLCSFQTGADCDRADGEGWAENDLLGLQGLCADQGREEPGDKEHKCEIIISKQFSGKIIFSGPLRLVNGAEL